MTFTNPSDLPPPPTFMIEEAERLMKKKKLVIKRKVHPCANMIKANPFWFNEAPPSVVDNLKYRQMVNATETARGRRVKTREATYKYLMKVFKNGHGPSISTHKLIEFFKGNKYNLNNTCREIEWYFRQCDQPY